MSGQSNTNAINGSSGADYQAKDNKSANSSLQRFQDNQMAVNQTEIIKEVDSTGNQPEGLSKLEIDATGEELVSFPLYDGDSQDVNAFTEPAQGKN